MYFHHRRLSLVQQWESQVAQVDFALSMDVFEASPVCQSQ